MVLGSMLNGIKSMEIQGMRLPLMSYAFQPIVGVQNDLDKPFRRRIYGYEALMRPKGYTPEELISLYRQSGGLHVLELATFYNAMLEFRCSRKESSQVFINSFPSESLTDPELEIITDVFPDIFPGLTIEILEDDSFDPEAIRRKLELREMYGTKLAIDDFETGTNNMDMVRLVLPDFVKIDRRFISGVDTDVKKQDALNRMIENVKIYDAQVIAEGVETAGEYAYLAELGTVDFVQGYFTGRPEI